MNKHGFTLFELLASIVIIAIIMGIFVFKMVDIIKYSKNKIYESQIKIVTDLASKYLPLTKKLEEGINYFSLQDLITDDVIESVLDPRCTNGIIKTDSKIEIVKKNNKIDVFFKPETTCSIYLSLLETLEQDFYKEKGKCVPDITSNLNTLYADTNCVYVKNNEVNTNIGDVTIRDSKYNYIKFNNQMYRIIKVVRDDNNIGIRALGNVDIISEKFISFSDVDNDTWDNSTIRQALNIEREELYNTILGPNITINLGKLIKMKYDIGNVVNNDCNMTSYQECAENQNINYSINEDYIGLLSLREVMQTTGSYTLSSIDNNQSWIRDDADEEIYWTLTSLYNSSSQNTMPGLWIGLSKTNFKMGSAFSSDLWAVRPVININPNVKVIKGNGTILEPYELE